MSDRLTLLLRCSVPGIKVMTFWIRLSSLPHLHMLWFMIWSFFFFLTTGTQLWQGNQELQSWALFFMSSIISVCIILTQWSSVTVVLFLFWKCAQLRGHVFHVSFYTLSDSFTFNLFPQLTCWMKKYLEESSISTLGSLKDFIVAYSVTILLH